MGLGNYGKKQNSGKLDELLPEIYSALFPRMDLAFPEFGWKKHGEKWDASVWPDGFPCPAEHKNPDRLTVYQDTPHRIMVQGRGAVRFLDYANGGAKPTGKDFVEAVRKLAGLAGVRFPEIEHTDEERERARKRDLHRDALSVLIDHLHETLLSEKGAAAREYLKGRGLSDDAIAEFKLGYYDSAGDVEEALRKAGVDEGEVREACLVWWKMEGRVVVPWRDERGFPLTVYGRWVGPLPLQKDHPGYREERARLLREWESSVKAGRTTKAWEEPVVPKYMALPGQETKRSPLFFDRAKKAGHKDLVLVEGAFDALYLQALGDSRVVASVAARLSELQVETLVRNRIGAGGRIFVCGDPDGGGDKGNLNNVEALTKAGIQSYVVPRLPEGMDPDVYVLEHGLEAWKKLVDTSVPGAVHKARVLLEGVTPDSPEHVRQDKAAELAAYAESLGEGRPALNIPAVLELISERTGYPAGAVSEVLEEHRRNRQKKEAERTFDEAVKEAVAARGRGDAAGDVARNLEEALASTRVSVSEAPPVFSVDRLEAESRSTPAGKSSGWRTLDKMEISFNPGELAVLGARTGHCKTSFLVGLLYNFLCRAEAEQDDALFVLYSQEEPEVRIFHRLLAILSKTGGTGWTVAEIRDYLRGGYGSRTADYEWKGSPLAFENAKARLRAWEDRLLVVHRPAWTVEQIADHARTVASRRPVAAFLVDYLQRVPPPSGGRYDRRDIEVSAVARFLKVLSVDLRAPVVTGAQVNREAIPDTYRKRLSGKSYEEAKTIIRDARPDLAHLREGGAEQEADLVLGLLNYAADLKTDADECRKTMEVPDVTRLEVGSLKNRYGVPGQWAALAFEGKFGTIRDTYSHEKDV